MSKIQTLAPPAELPFILAWEQGNATAIAEGSSRALWLHQPAYQATFTVTNTGSVFGGVVCICAPILVSGLFADPT